MDVRITGSTFVQFFFNINITNNIFKLYKFPDEKAGGVPYEKIRVEIERNLDISDYTAADLQNDIIGPNIIGEYREQYTKTMQDVGYTNILAGFPSSVFQDFESYLRTEIDLVEDDFRLVLDESNSSFITYDLQPGLYLFKDLSEALLNILNSNIQNLAAKLLLNLILLPGKLK